MRAKSLFLALLTAVFGLSAAHGATLTVTKTADTNDGVCNADCSLREAIAVSQSGDSIVFGVNGTITLTLGELFVNKTLTLAGPGAHLLTISGNNQSRVFMLAQGSNVTLDQLTIGNGRAGGGQFNLGGAIFNNRANLTISNSALTGNTAAGDSNSNSVGGAIYTEMSSTVKIINSTISGNTVSGDNCTGGAISNANNCTLTIINSTLSGNSVNGIAVGAGGSISNDGGGTVTLVNSTISGNSVASSNSPFAAGIHNGGTVNLRNTIIAGNSVSGPGGNSPDVYGPLNSLGNNLIGNTQGVTISGTTTGNQLNVDPLLAPLANYGGLTQTHALLPGSPVINGGDNCVLTNSCASHNAGFNLDADQRGVARPQAGSVDMGAYESRGFSVTETGGDNQSTTVNTAFADPLSVSVTPIAAGEPVNGGQVIFITPSSGPSATVAPVTISNGAAVSGTVTANGLTGSYAVTASVRAGSTDFTLTNTCQNNPAVTNTNDSGVGSLRAAVSAACPGSTLNLNLPANSNITLTTGEILIDKDLTLTGPGANLLTVSGNNQSRVFKINPGVTVTIERLTIANGRAPSGQFSQGGGIYNQGVLNFNNGAISGCVANLGRGNGGGIYNQGGTVTISGSTLSGNTAGISANSWGGAIYTAFGTVTIINSTLSGNAATGGFFTESSGGGIFHASGTMTLINSTIAGNSASGSTSSNNRGGGIFVSGGTVNLQNSIIAGNTVSGGNSSAPDVAGSLNSLGHNLIGNTQGASVGGTTTGNILDQPAQLAALGDHGGPTRTMALLAGSPAINAGVAVTGVTSDQRGLARPQGAAPDIGAFEVMAPPVVTVNPQNQEVPLDATATFTALANYLYGGTAPSTLCCGAALLPGEYLLSPNHGYQLVYQGDGNLVLFRGDGVALWGSGTAGQTPGQVIMQADGNLVIYGPGGPQWASNTAGNPNALLALQDDGNLVIYGATPVFATHTVQSAQLRPIPTVQWQMSTDGGATFTDIAGATSLTLSVPGSLANNNNRYRATFTNASGVVVPTAPATLTILTGLQVFRNFHSLAPDGSQDLANPSGDGVANLLKYAFNMAPNAGDLAQPNISVLQTGGSAGLPFFEVDAQGRLTIEFVRRKASSYSGIDYIVETGSDLNDLMPLSLDSASVVSIDATWERVTATDPTVSSKRFGRVRIEVP